MSKLYSPFNMRLHQRRASLTGLFRPSSPVLRACILLSLCVLLLLVSCIYLATHAFAATWPVPSARPSAAMGFHDTYSAGISSEKSYVHSGVDATASAGSQIVSPIAGVVCFTGSIPSGDSSLNGGGPGQTMLGVSVKMADGKVLTLMPFAQVAVRRGQHVAEGAVVGTLAASGDRSMSTPHVHMGLKKGRTYFDPMTLFGMSSSRSAGARSQHSASAANATAGTADAPVASASASKQPVESPDGQHASESALATEVEAAVAEQASRVNAARSSTSAARSAAVPQGKEQESFGAISSGEVAFVAKPQEDLLAAPKESLVCFGDACARQAMAVYEALCGIAENLRVPVEFIVLACGVLCASACAALVFAFARCIRPNAMNLWKSLNLHLARMKAG